MRRGKGSWTSTARVVFDALLRPANSLASGSCPASPLRRAGAEEEVSVFFAGCLPVAATAILFRVKREGFSSCRAETSADGIRLYCRR